MVDSFWRALESEAGVDALPRAVRAFIEEEGYPAEWERVSDAEELRDIARRAALAVVNLEAAGLVSDSGDRLSVHDFGAESQDPRWSLLAELDAHLARQAGAEPDWSPLRVCHISSSAGVPTEERLVVSIDPQLPLRHVVSQLTRLWPSLQDRSWQRRTRPLNQRSADLVRFVCLENPPGSPWEELWRRWNDEHPNPDDRYNHETRFRAEFHRVEKQVSGRKRGLAVFYDRDASALVSRDWKEWRLGELEEMARQGDPRARRVFEEIAKAAEDEMARRQGEAESSRPKRREASLERSGMGTSGSLPMMKNTPPPTSGTAGSVWTRRRSQGERGASKSAERKGATDKRRKASGGAA